MKITVFRDVKTCSLVDSCEHFGKSLPSPSSVNLESTLYILSGEMKESYTIASIVTWNFTPMCMNS